MNKHFDHIVVGGGVVGLAVTWQLAQRGHRVLLLERFEQHHTRGASHGSTRNMNNAYDERHFLDLYDEALVLWRDLEQRSGAQLLSLHGLVTHGDAQKVADAREALLSRGVAIESLAAVEAAKRWPGMRFENDVLLTRDAGVVHAARALEQFAVAARAAGASLRFEHRVLEIDPSGGAVTVTAETPEGARHTFSAPSVVVAVGAWSEPLLSGLAKLQKLTVTEEHPAHFAVRNPGAAWPSFNHFLSGSQADSRGGNVYGMPSPGEGVKVGFHRVGETVDPDRRPFGATEALRNELREYVSEWFPGLDPTSAEEISCTYTSTASGRFILDRVGSITVAAGFSGHGFKFAPAIGRVLADAATEHSLPPDPFRIGEP